MPRPWSRHDFAFTASAVTLAGIAAGVVAGLWGEFEAYPRLYAPLDAATLGAIAVLMLSAVLPFADRRGI
jgi:energy-coupling factor transport system permease protein